jgi:hypothetical protein
LTQPQKQKLIGKFLQKAGQAFGCDKAILAVAGHYFPGPSGAGLQMRSNTG